MSAILRVFFLASVVVLLLSLEQVNGQCSCRDAPCRGGPYDKCLICASYCPPTCANPRPKTCTQACRTDVCQCTGGTVRAPNGKCVWPSQCPRRPIYLN